jgi:hypothetical protein
MRWVVSVAGCGSCHQGLAPTGTTARLDTDSLGYGPRTAASVVVGTNKAVPGRQPGQHLQPVPQQRDELPRTVRSPRCIIGMCQSKKRDCAACHNFSRPERSLSLSKN